MLVYVVQNTEYSTARAGILLISRLDAEPRISGLGKAGRHPKPSLSQQVGFVWGKVKKEQN